MFKKKAQVKCHAKVNLFAKEELIVVAVCCLVHLFCWPEMDALFFSLLVVLFFVPFFHRWWFCFSSQLNTSKKC